LLGDELGYEQGSRTGCVVESHLVGGKDSRFPVSEWVSVGLGVVTACQGWCLHADELPGRFIRLGSARVGLGDPVRSEPFKG